jgi:hypothetical protein
MTSVEPMLSTTATTVHNSGFFISIDLLCARSLHPSGARLAPYT